MLILTDFVERIKTQLIAAGVAGGNVEPNLGRPTKAEDLPVCIVAIPKDEGKAAGDSRVPMPEFSHTTTIGVLVQDIANSGDELRTKLHAHGDALHAALLGDLSWGGDVLEGVAAIRTMINAPTEGESYIGSVEVQIDALSYSNWPQPLPADATDLTGIDITHPLGNQQIDLPQD